MSSYSIQQQNVIKQYRDANNLGFVLSDDAVVEMILKDMEKTGKVYQGFAELARTAIANKGTVDKNLFGTGFISNTDSEITFVENETFLQLPLTKSQEKALEFLRSIISDAENIVAERDKEGGDFSYLINLGKELLNDEYSRANVKKQIAKSKADFELLEQAAKGEAFSTFLGQSTPISFEEMFLKRREVEFSEKLIQDCENKSKEYARIKTSYDAINCIKQKLQSATLGDIKSQLTPAKSTAIIVEAFKLCGINSLDEINNTLSDIAEKNKTNPIVEKYGDNFHLGKNSNGDFVVYRTAKNGYPAEATNETLQLIVSELCSRLDKSFANSIGVELAEGMTSQEVAPLLQAEVAKHQKVYEQSFQNAYGKKELKSLADTYVQKQQQTAANIEAAITIGSMALMILPGGVTATSGWLLKGATGARAVKALQVVNSAAKTMQGVQQVVSLPLMANMTLRPIELWEQLSSENGMSKEEWEAWGQSVLQNTVYMAAGMGASKLAEAGAAYYKTSALVSTLKEAGKTVDEISALVKANPVKFPEEIVKSLNRVDNLAKTLQVSSEVALDLVSTVAVNKLMGNGDLLSQDVVMSIGFALSGGVLQKQFMPLSTDAKVKFLQDAFKDVNLSHDDALKILKTMDEISAGKLSADDYKKQLLPSDEQMNIITKPNEELPMIDYGQRTPSELARLKELYRESLSQEELDILVKLPKDEEYAISYLMHGKGLSFENSRYHYALPEEVKAKADIVLQHIPLENIKNYKEFITKIVDFTEEEIYSIADLVSWSKGEADADVCLEIANVCREIPDKLQQMKNISKLYYKNETIFTAEDLLKIAKSEADFSSVIKFFEIRKSFYAQEAFNLDNVEFKESSELVDFACLINEYNILPLSELCYYKSQKKLDLDFLKDVAEVIKDEGARDEITLAERILGTPYDSLKSFIADYKENPTMAVALVKVRCYQPGISDGMMTFKDEFSTHYVSKCFDSWTHQDIVATYHKEFMDNLEKFPEETQASLKELYLNPNYNQIGMVAMSRLEDPSVFIKIYPPHKAKDILECLYEVTNNIKDVPAQEVFNVIQKCNIFGGFSTSFISKYITPETFPLVAKMIDCESVSYALLEELLMTIKDFNIEVHPQSIDNVLSIIKDCPALLAEAALCAKLLSIENVQFISALDFGTVRKEPMTTTSLYNASFKQFSAEAQRFGCDSLEALEEYFKTTTVDKPVVGKLLGKIKKHAQENVLNNLPPLLQRLVIGETGSFTAKDLEELVAKMNKSSSLQALLQATSKQKGELPDAARNTIAFLLLDTSLERRLLDSTSKLDVNFKQELVFAENVHEKIFLPKMKEMVNNMPPREANKILAQVQEDEFKLEFYPLLFNAKAMLGESALKNILHNNAPVKILMTLDSLTNVSDPLERALWAEFFSAKGLKDNEISQLVSMVGNIDLFVLEVFKDKFLQGDKLDVAGMINDCMNLIANNAGLWTFDTSGWDLRYAPFIIKAQKTLPVQERELLNKILVATNEGTYKEFLFDKNQVHGRLNIETRKTFENEGLDFDTWMNYDKVHKFTLAPSKSIDNIAPIIQSLESDIKLMLENEKLVPLVNSCILKSGFEYNGTNLVSKNGKTPTSAELSVLVENLIQFGKDHGRELRDIKLLELRDHFLARKRGLKQLSTTSEPEELTISLWKRDPKHDLFQGHYCACCIALDGINSRAIVHSLSHVVDNTIELKTSSGETIGKAKVLWMRDNKTNEPVFLVNGFEITGGKEYNLEVRDAFLDFFKDYSKAVAGKEVMIVTADCSYQKVNIDDLKDFSSNINLLGSFPHENASTTTYHLDTFNKQETSWPKHLEEPKDLTTKIMYQPSDFRKSHVKLLEELSDETIKLMSALDALGVKYDGMALLRIPDKYKDAEILLDNVKKLSKQIEKLNGSKDKDKHIEFAVSALFDENVKVKIYSFAETIHVDTKHVDENLTRDIGILFDDTDSENIVPVENGKGYSVDYFEPKQKTEIGSVYGRAKSVDSIYSKIMNEILELEHEEANFYAFNKAVRDAYGFRVIAPDNALKSVPEIINNAAQTHKDVFNSYDSKIDLQTALEGFYDSGFKSSVWKQLAPDQQQVVLEIAIENKSQPFVDRLISLINNDKIMIEKISNYVTAFEEKIPYLTARQQMLISDAVSAKTGKPAVNYYKKPYSTRGSGYTAAQMNIKVLDYDTNIELQYRDEGTSEFAEKEHVPYDISENKITVRGKKYDSPRQVLKNLDVDGETLYAKFRSDVYAYYRLKALGVRNLEKPDITKMFEEAIANGQKVFKESPPNNLKEYLEVLSEEGLSKLTH